MGAGLYEEKGREEGGEAPPTKRGSLSQTGQERLAQPKWLDCIGKGSWEKGSPIPELKEFRVGNRVC